jgi:Xaa-Pro aminopeptidase
MAAVDHAARRDRLVSRLPDLEVEALLVTRLVNVRYLTGFTGSNAQLLLAPNEGVLFTDSRYEEQSAHEVPDLRRVVYPRAFVGAVAEACRKAGITRVGFEAAGVTFKTHRDLAGNEGLDLVPTEDEVERLRWAKDAEEIGLIARAQEITDEAFEQTIGKLAEGMTERQVAFELEQTMRHLGAERIGFDTIVAFGESAAEPHHHPTDRPLGRGEMVKLDFGCVVEGYHSDMTRTVALGEPSSQLREVYEVVLRAHLAGAEAVRAGTTGGAADEAARAVIRKAGYGDRFGHSLGHGVGLEIHEGPTLRSGSEDVLPAGTVVTVEPGIYLPGVGGVRIEDMVEVTEDGRRAMPRTPRELRVA